MANALPRSHVSRSRASPIASTGPAPEPSSRSPRATAAPARARAIRAAAGRSRPRASCAARIAEWVHPEPWAAPPGWRSPAISTTSASGPASSRSAACGAVPAGEDHRSGPEREHRAREPLGFPGQLLLALGRARQHAGLLQVRRHHAWPGAGCARPASARRRARSGGRPTRPPSRGRPPPACPREARRGRPRTALAVSSVPSIPTLTASTPMSSSTARTCASTISGSTVATALTSRVFWAVIAVIADGPVHATAGEGLQVGLDPGAACPSPSRRSSARSASWPPSGGIAIGRADRVAADRRHRTAGPVRVASASRSAARRSGRLRRASAQRQTTSPSGDGLDVVLIELQPGALGSASGRLRPQRRAHTRWSTHRRRRQQGPARAGGPPRDGTDGSGREATGHRA